MLQKAEEGLVKTNKVVKGYDMEDELLGLTRVAIAKHQDSDINKQIQMFEQWEQNRSNLLQQQIRDYKMQRKKAELAKRLRELQAQEEKLSYFEQYDKIQLGIQNRPTEKQVTAKQKI